jgi:hypothetical protein
MLDFYPAENKKKFVTAFIREAILNTSSAKFYFLEELISRKEGKRGDFVSVEEEIKPKKLEKEEIKEIVKDYYKKSPRERVREYFRETGDKVNFDIDFKNYDAAGKEIKFKEVPPVKRVIAPSHRVQRPPVSRQVLRVPESFGILPERFKNLRPIRTNQPIDLGKLNILLNDKNVISIECQGSGTSVFVNGRMGRKPTNIMLSNEEINKIIENFSEKSRIPIEEGLYKVAYGGLVLTATISSSGSNFIIKKI